MSNIFDSFLDETDNLYTNQDGPSEKFKELEEETPIDDMEELHAILGNSTSYNAIYEDNSSIDDSIQDENYELLNALSEDLIENITDIDYNEIYDDSDIGDSSHLRLAEENLDTDKTFTTFIESKLQYPCLLIDKDRFVRAQIENLFSIVEEGTTPLVINCRNQMEKIHSVKLNPTTIINLQRIFKTDIRYLEDENTNKPITPLDLIDQVDIELDI